IEEDELTRVFQAELEKKQANLSREYQMSKNEFETELRELEDDGASDAGDGP
ncbi:hypothetical protein FDECE_9083, partial [Fusarium decemcellulare]